LLLCIILHISVQAAEVNSHWMLVCAACGSR